MIFIQESALDYGLAQCRNGMSDKGLPLINKILKDAMSKNNVEMATTSLIYLGTAHLWNNDWVNSKKHMTHTHPTIIYPIFHTDI